MAIHTFSNNSKDKDFNQILETNLFYDTDYELPQGGDIGSADFNRLGDDLLLTFQDGHTTLLTGFFQNGYIENLVGNEGARIPVHIIDILAGSKAPGQFAQAAPGATAEPVGTVETEEGSVFAVRADGSRDELNAGDPIFQGDTLETGTDGLLKVAFIDESTLSMDQSARLVVDEMIFDPGSQDGNGVLFALQGTMNFISGGIATVGPDTMLINTPVATIGIRGTSVLIYLDPPVDPNAPPELTVVLGPEVNPDGTDSLGEIYIVTNISQITLNQPFDSSRVESINQAPSEVQTMSLTEAARVYGSVLLSNSQNISPELRDTIEKVIDQIEAEDEKIEAEIELNEALDLQESTQLAALAKAEEVIIAQAQVNALQEALASGELTEEELLALQAQLQEAQALVNLLEGEVGDLQLQLDEAISALEAAQTELDAANATLDQATTEAEEAIDAVSENLGVAELASNTNLTGQNEIINIENEEEFTVTDNEQNQDEEVDLNEGDFISETDDVFNIVTDTEDAVSFEGQDLIETVVEAEDDTTEEEENNNSSQDITLGVIDASGENDGYRIIAGTPNSLGVSGDLEHYTIEAWIKFPTFTGPAADQGRIFTAYTASDDLISIEAQNNSTAFIRLILGNQSATAVVTSFSRFSFENEWHHIAVVSSAGDSNNNVAPKTNLYIDGSLIREVSFSYVIPNGENLIIGDDQNTDAFMSPQFMTEFKLWKHDNSSAADDKISDILRESYRTSQIANPENKSDLLAYLSFDESSGNTVTNKADNTTLSITKEASDSLKWKSDDLPNLNRGAEDPLIIDLDGDGIELVGLDAGIYFDTDADGLLENTGWFDAGDGLLVVDINEDNTINDMSEVVSHYFNYQNRNDNGLLFSSDVLALYDDNKDNVIDANDGIFNVLKIWQDSDQNGQTDSGELIGLKDHFITSISLETIELNTTSNGNRITNEGQVTFLDGTDQKWNEVWFDAGEEINSYSSSDQNKLDNKTSDIMV